MKYLLILSGIITSIYLYNDWLDLEFKRQQLPQILQKISHEKVNIFDAKKALNLYVESNCIDEQVTLELNGSTINECIAYQDTLKLECEIKVFRLAPVEFDQKSELLEYSNRYMKCVLPSYLNGYILS